MSGSRKNALVTGGTDGVRKEVARGLAGTGHRVIAVGRDAEKGLRLWDLSERMAAEGLVLEPEAAQ